MRNLLESTQIATLFLDGNLHIKSFTPGMRDLFHLREGDRGRPVTDIVTRLNYRELNRDAENVLRELNMVEREVDLLDGEPKSFIMRIRPYRTVDNVIDGVVITFTDITERTRGEAERVRLAEIVRSSHDAIIGHSLGGTIESWNPAAERMFGYSAAEATGQPMTLLVSADRAAEVTEPLERLQRGEASAPFDLGCQTRAGERVDVELSMSPVIDEQGKLIAAATVARDISARLQHEAHRDLLMHELSHRIKNTLATVQSIMMQTQAHAATIEEFNQSFSERLRALSNAHNLLTRSDWSGADFRELVLAELKPYANNDHPRWELSGGSVRIAPNETIALSMAFHELVTNAAKHGALSTAGGRIELSWAVADAGDGRRMLHLEWVERDGPTVEKPARRGFGSRLLNEGLSYELDAKVALDFDPKGVRCIIDVPIDPVENSGG